MPPRRERRDMTVLMAVNEISRLFGRAIKISEKPGSAMSQDSFRLILIALSHHDGATQLELSGITFMDSSGLGLIMGRYSLVKELGGTLLLRSPSVAVMKILSLAGMDKMIKIEASSKEDKNNEVQ